MGTFVAMIRQHKLDDGDLKKEREKIWNLENRRDSSRRDNVIYILFIFIRFC